ncbi:MAG: SusC/RagA family TonB-linked outer membrane protein [Cytophagales bacterium]|nr:SusC/RagA family TonB-linked outer membrane protein [Cytophagales bacterium]
MTECYPGRTFSGSFLTKWLLLALLWLPTTLLAQSSYTVKGKVADASTGEGIPGASVVVAGTTNGTVTDAGGNYSLKLNAAAGTYRIAFSYVGYSPVTETVKTDGSGETTLNVSLQADLVGLDEIVITGTGTPTSKRELGTYVTSVSAKQLANTAANNPLAALQGKVAGAQISQNNGNPAGGFTVRLRGASTIIGSSEPLYIIDGVIVNNSTNNVTDLSISISGNNDFQPGANRLADINPNDIERIEVLNGAAAAAIYGSRANNGVVQIFTKRGAEGKPRITFSTSVVVSELRKRIEINDFGQRFGNFDPMVPYNSAIGSGPYTDQRLTTIFLGGRLFRNTSPVTRYDYQDDIFRRAVGTDNYISVTGGTDKTKYLVSGSYFNNQGIVPGTDFRRYSAKLRIDQTLNSWAKASIGLNYVNSLANERPDGNSFYSPINAFFITDNVYDIRRRDANGFLMPVEPNRVNPITVLEDIKMTNATNRVIGDFQLNLTPLKGLTIDFISGLDTYTQLGQTYIAPMPYPGVNPAFFPDGYASTATAQVFQVNNDLNATYRTNITPKISSTTTLGGTVQYDRSNFTQIQGRAMLPLIETVAGAQNFFTPAGEIRTERSIQGAFLQQTFGYDGFVFVSAAGRVDGSSVFGVNNRTQFYPKVSGNLLVSELLQRSGINTFDLLKLRAAYGESGNLTAIGPYDRFSNMDPVVTAGGAGFVRRTTLGNPNVQVERQTEFEAGLDASVLNGRLGVEFNVYNKNVRDLLLPLAIAPTQGGSQIFANIGGMTNRGVELVLRATPVKAGDFTWNATVIFNRNRNRVSLPFPLLRFSADANRMSSAVDGQPLGVFYGTVYARNPDGSLLLSPGPRALSPTVSTDAGVPFVDRVGRTPEGLPNPSTALVQRVVGDPNPRWTGSLINEFQYKRFTARVLLDAVQGFNIVNLNRTTYNNVGAGLLAERELRGEVPRGTVSIIGGFGDERIREDMVEDGSFVKLREITFGYSVAPKLWGLSNLSVNLTGRNLYSWDNYQGWDPEINSGGQSNRIRGDDFGTVPIPRTYQVSLTASF